MAVGIPIGSKKLRTGCRLFRFGDAREALLPFLTLVRLPVIFYGLTYLICIQVNAARSLHHDGMLDPVNRDEAWEEEAGVNPIAARSLTSQVKEKLPCLQNQHDDQKF